MSDNSYWVTLPRFLYKNLGVKWGLGRVLMNAAARQPRLQNLPVRLCDGRILTLDLREVMSLPYVLTGEIWEEGGETQLVRHLVARGDLAIDIGTNVGWYSTLMSECVSPDGAVVGFEPNPVAYSLIKKTAEQYPQLTIVNSALSDFEGETSFYTASDGGQSSLREFPDFVSVQSCKVTSLDRFLASWGNPHVKFVKCDAEGAELNIVRGANELILSEAPPMWMLEINVPMMERFGASAEQIFDVFRSAGRHEYRFYRIHSQTGKLEPLPEGFTFRFDAVIVPKNHLGVIEEYNRK